MNKNKKLVLTLQRDIKWQEFHEDVPKNYIYDFEAFYNGHLVVRHDYSSMVYPIETFVVVQADWPNFCR